MNSIRLLSLFLCLMLGACATRGQMNALEIGMTKQAVMAQVGQPRTKTVAPYGESWNYRTYGVGGPTSYMVAFGSDGTLISFGPDDQSQIRAEKELDAFIWATTFPYLAPPLP